MAAQASMQRAFLSRPAANPYAVGKAQTCQFHRVVDARLGKQRAQRGVLQALQRVQG
jgi:hypothetical protein